MEKFFIISSGIATILTLIALALLIKAFNSTKKNMKQAENTIMELVELIKKMSKKNQDLEHLRLVEEHKNDTLKKKHMEIENILNGNRTSKEKLEKIEEVIFRD